LSKIESGAFVSEIQEIKMKEIKQKTEKNKSDIPLLQIENLTISFSNDSKWDDVVKNVSLELKPNEILGIVGESGSGKSVLSLSILGLLPPKKSRISDGKISFDNQNIVEKSEKELQKIRGKQISMIFQEPMTSLNPSMKCGVQVGEILSVHTSFSSKKIKEEVLCLFEKVKFSDSEKIYNSYPHQISGGQKQRVMIAMAIACQPKILIADEPTTALDVTVQKEIIAILKDLQRQTKMSVIFISHDLSLIHRIADRTIVMYKGQIVEQGKTNDIFHSPKQVYTKALLTSRPSLEVRLKRLPTISDFINNTISDKVISEQERRQKHQKMYSNQPILEVKNIEKAYYSKIGFFGKKQTFKAIDNVSFSVFPGETKGLVGESGSGKSTIGNAILQLEKVTKGQIFYNGIDIAKLSEKEMKSFRREIQIVFQDPYSSLNPKMTVGKAIIEPMQVHKLYKNDKQRKQKVIEILERVGLSQEHFNRYPHQFSGGQRQRIGIARAIAIEPKLIVCDESVSALDISVQAQVLNLLNELKENFGFTYIFISHDLAVVKYMSDKIIVLNKGRIEEETEADILYKNPRANYSKNLITAIPKF